MQKWCEKWRRERAQEGPEGFWVKWIGEGTPLIPMQNVTAAGIASSAFSGTKPAPQPCKFGILVNYIQAG